MSQQLWKDYLAATAGRAARPLLVKALEACEKPGRALDLGAGAGGDSLALLRAGFSVLAVDSLPESVEALRVRAQEEALGDRLETLLLRFEELHPTPGELQLVNASYSLPFCAPQAFERLWRDLIGALVPGGVFAGQFFGDRDAWAQDAEHPAQIFVDRAQLDRLLAGLEVLHLEEEEERRPTALGGDKDWHLFHVVARVAR